MGEAYTDFDDLDDEDLDMTLFMSDLKAAILMDDERQVSRLICSEPGWVCTPEASSEDHEVNPVILAIINGSNGALKALLEESDCIKWDLNGFSVGHWAAASGNVGAVALFIQHGGRVTQKEKDVSHGKAMLGIAVSRGEPEMTALILEAIMEERGPKSFNVEHDLTQMMYGFSKWLEHKADGNEVRADEVMECLDLCKDAGLTLIPYGGCALGVMSRMAHDFPLNLKKEVLEQAIRLGAGEPEEKSTFKAGSSESLWERAFKRRDLSVAMFLTDCSIPLSKEQEGSMIRTTIVECAKEALRKKGRASMKCGPDKVTGAEGWLIETARKHGLSGLVMENSFRGDDMEGGIARAWVSADDEEEEGLVEATVNLLNEHSIIDMKEVAKVMAERLEKNSLEKRIRGGRFLEGVLGLEVIALMKETLPTTSLWRILSESGMICTDESVSCAITSLYRIAKSMTSENPFRAGAKLADISKDMEWIEKSLLITGLPSDFGKAVTQTHISLENDRLLKGRVRAENSWALGMEGVSDLAKKHPDKAADLLKYGEMVVAGLNGWVTDEDPRFTAIKMGSKKAYEFTSSVLGEFSREEMEDALVRVSEGIKLSCRRTLPFVHGKESAAWLDGLTENSGLPSGWAMEAVDGGARSSEMHEAMVLHIASKEAQQKPRKRI